ncbi:MAG: M16 family metallopeptidase [Armatimonadota bacterium]
MTASTMRMAKAVFAALAVLFLLGTRSTAADYPFAHVRPERLRIRELKFDPPEPHRTVLPNGMVVYLLEDHDLPIVRVTAYVKAGSIYEPSNRLGLASLVGTVLRTGGTESMTGDQFDEALEKIAASIESSIGLEYGTVSLSVLSKDLDEGLRLFADVLVRPAFREDKLELARQQALEAIRRRNDDAVAIARREFARLVYGADSPWSRIPTPDTVRAITRDDVKQFHACFFRPNNTILAVSGDVRRDEMLRKLEALFAGWERRDVALPTVAPVEERFQPGVYHIHKPVPQAVVVMGHLGIRRMSPERYAVQVMNAVLGSEGFVSRMVNKVRTERGLAYTVGAAVSPGADRGLFRAIAMTSASRTAEVIRVMRAVIADMQGAPPSNEEMKVAKDTIVNSFVFQYNTASKLVSARAELEMLGYPPGYLEEFPDGIRRVTKDEVLSAARMFLHPDRLVILVVGDKDQLQSQLEALGPVRTIALERTD